MRNMRRDALGELSRMIEARSSDKAVCVKLSDCVLVR